MLFTDMVAFSTISDRLAIEGVSELVSTYLETCSTAIVRSGGEVTKFLGDGVMAYFEADAADEALQSCVDIHRELSQIRETATVRSARRLLYSGFGLALGPVIEGSMGLSVKMDYTIIGEPVNTAAKLQTLTRTLNTPFLTTEAVARATRRQWQLRFVDGIDLGLDHATPVHALSLDPPGTMSMRAVATQYLDVVTNPPS